VSVERPLMFAPQSMKFEKPGRPASHPLVSAILPKIAACPHHVGQGAAAKAFWNRAKSSRSTSPSPLRSASRQPSSAGRFGPVKQE
jgi:hypothetical protein